MFNTESMHGLYEEIAWVWILCHLLTYCMNLVKFLILFHFNVLIK